MPKKFWLYSDTWRDQDSAQGECLVLGGEYTVWKIVNEAIYLQDKYCKYDIPNTVGADDLVLAAEFTRCAFNVGDTVSPKEQFDFDSFKSELPTYDAKYFSSGRHGEHRVVGILNGRYVFIDYEQLGDYSFPFAADDFAPSRKQRRLNKNAGTSRDRGGWCPDSQRKRNDEQM